MTGHVGIFAQAGDTGSKLREWSSLIGIVTAIVGNILISFALNLQRYAHIRLERERNGDHDEWKKSRDRGYGTEQSEIAERRAELNLHAPLYEGLHSDHGTHLDKADPLNGYESSKNLKLSTHSRTNSDSTTQPPEKKDTANTKSYLRSPYWWAGMLLMIIGESGNFLAYGFAPASIVSPLGVVALVSNCIIAPCLLKERFRQRDFWGVVVAVGGACTVVLSAKNSEAELGPQDLWSAITRWEFELYLLITAVLIIILMWVSSRYGQRSILIDLGLVGLFGGYTALSTKGVASLLSGTLWHTLTFPVTYLLVFILVLTAFFQIRYLNRALQRFDSTQVIPTQFVLFTLSVIIGSAILYREFEKADAKQFVKFFGGCFLTFLGVYLITSGRVGDNDSPDDLDFGSEEEAISLVDEERNQHLNGGSDGEGDGARRKSKSKSSFTLDKGQASEESRRGQSSPPRTPHRDSFSSSTMSRAVTDASERDHSTLRQNPWRSSTEDVLNPSLRPRPMENTVSTPLLPSDAQRLDPSASRPSNRQPPSPYPSDPASAIKRNSMSRMMPGPLMSPLSSPLSAIVADSLRRGVDTSSVRRRPRLSGPRPLRSYQLSTEDGSGARSQGSSPMKSAQDPSGEDEEGWDNRRHSIATAFGDIFRPKRDRGKESSSGDDGRTDER